MFKSILFSLVAIVMMNYSVSAQESYQDDRIKVTTEVLKFEDEKNDRFFSYYNFTLENISNENQKFELVLNYHQNGEERSSQSQDESLVFELEPGESFSGDIDDLKKLTLFKSFLTGNSGKKASNSKIELNSISINYL